ncbi:nucleoside-diphosphate kinase [Cryptococcus wingfieldii CBS 7118]|uniref:Nucleoside diphosphate kinase n=1 Tax=Cryptococcus wingfieldii CBS 7118 TaxID=1295528 RepID=A0A1E3J0M9_9TREE|nr:nucleoside-diphosphate kinase [Cryptococcus wingfieldii CBS 7118]ODN94372.1 nucleoside-diphosphate kinase [Cryptococcus wingfieldii CBS 7118]
MFANSLRQGLRTASRSSGKYPQRPNRSSLTPPKARAFSTLPARAAPRANIGAGLAAGAAVAGYAFYESTRSPVLLEGPKTIAGEKGTVSERSFVMIKPDGVSRQLVGKIVSRFEERGYKLVAIKSLTPSPALAKEHYADLSARPFYGSLVKYITSGTPVVAMVWEGKDVIKQGRRIVGATNPQDADPGSVRGQYAVSVGRNLIHASDAFDSATKEIGLWFAQEELSDYEPWVMADN